MAYGFKCNSSVDGSTILTTEHEQTYYIGKATLSSSTLTIPSSYVHQQFRRWKHVYTISTSEMPLIFMHGLDGYNYLMLAAELSGGVCYITVFQNEYTTSLASVPPTLYCFKTQYITGSYAHDYGMKLKDSVGNVIFDSRSGLKLLSLKKFDQVSVAPGTYMSVSGITKPALMYSPLYLRTLYWTIVNYNYIYEIEFMYQRLTGSNIYFSPYSSFNHHLADRNKDFIGTGVHNTRIPVISGSDYD